MTSTAQRALIAAVAALLLMPRAANCQAEVLLELRFGLRPNSPMAWTGSITLSSGNLQKLDARLQNGDLLQGDRWTLRRLAGRPVRVYARVSAPPSGSVTVTTQAGAFTFRLADLKTEASLYLDGEASVQRVRPGEPVVASSTDDDFPAAATAPDGTIWVAYASYRRASRVPQQYMSPELDAAVAKGDWSAFEPKGHGDQIRLVSRKGDQWSVPLDVTESGGDVWRPAVSVDREGAVWVSWAQSDNGNWEIFRRRYRGRWDALERVSDNAGPDFNVASTTDRSGQVWWTWQSWNGTDFDIAVRAQRDSRFARTERWTVPGNQWNPAIAADSRGRVYVAWDGYEHGNYDVSMRRIDSSSAGEPIAVAASPKFEARPSLACDSSGRVWIAYEESGEGWGKDFGRPWENNRGIPFHLQMRTRLLVYTEAGFQEPTSGLPVEPTATQTLPAQVRISFPRIGFDPGGRLWLLYRKHRDLVGEGEHWVSYATSYAGSVWTAPEKLASSDHTLDMRPALAAQRSGEMLAVYAGDGRLRHAIEFDRQSRLYATSLAGPPAAGKWELTPVSVSPTKASADAIRERALVKRIRDVRVEVRGRTYRLLRGEFHRHTELSAHRDWYDGPYENVWRYGLDVAAADWIGNGDHDGGYGEYPWWLIQKQTEMYQAPSVFTPMYTYERSLPYPNGHRNVMFDRRGVFPLPRYETADPKGIPAALAPFAGRSDTRMLYAYLRHFGGISSPHTSATDGGGTDWRDNDPSAEPVVEVFQGMRRSYEHAGAPKAPKGGDIRPKGFIWNALQQGHRLGFQCSSDHVSTHISFGVVFAEQNSPSAILDGFRRRHSYGATDNIVLVVRTADHLMGDEFEASEPPELQIRVEGTAPISQVDIIRGIGQEPPAYVYAAEPHSDTFRIRWRDRQLTPAATTYWYVRVQQADGNIAWSSPIWVRGR